MDRTELERAAQQQELKEMEQNPTIMRALNDHFNRTERKVLAELSKRGIYPNATPNEPHTN